MWTRLVPSRARDAAQSQQDALALGILNAMWFEVRVCQREEAERKERAGVSSEWE
jgi:predicted outer membrane lipoprotein